MMLHIPGVLGPEQLNECRRRLQQAPWADGVSHTELDAALFDGDLQLAEESVEAREIGALISQALQRNPLFIAAALPDKLYPPLFSCQRGGPAAGLQVDRAVRLEPRTGGRVRADLSAVLFFTDPDEYEGGDLLVEDTYGAHSVKLPAGDLLLYSATSLYRVAPVSRGARVCAQFWIQSMVRDAAQRSLLFELDTGIQRVNQELGAEHRASVQLSGVYHNLLRRWAL